MSRIGSALSLCRRYYARRQRLAIYRRFKPFTMISPQIFIENLTLADRVKRINGCVVECGVWRGGMSAGIATVLGPSRKYFLFDSFEGLPPAKEIDGPAAREWQQRTDAPDYHQNCSAESHFAQQAMRQAGAKNVELVTGWFEKTVPPHRLGDPIALLRLDGDWYESTIVCLENLFHRVVPGGLIIIDDYYTWDGCSRAVHDFLSARSAIERIECSGAVCFITKAA